MPACLASGRPIRGPREETLESLGLKRAAEVVAGAIVEKVKLITNDKKVAKVVAEIVGRF